MDLRESDGTKRNRRRLPLFDVALLLLLIIALIGGLYWATHRTAAPECELTYTIRFAAVENAHSGSFAVGKSLYLWSENDSGRTAIGSIVYADVTRAKVYTFDPATATEPYRYTQTRSTESSDILITVRVVAQERDGGYFVNGVRIAAGMTLPAMVDGYLGEGRILTVQAGGQEAS